jgi:hypothetical protein
MNPPFEWPTTNTRRGSIATREEIPRSTAVCVVGDARPTEVARIGRVPEPVVAIVHPSG